MSPFFAVDPGLRVSGLALFAPDTSRGIPANTLKAGDRMSLQGPARWRLVGVALAEVPKRASRKRAPLAMARKLAYEGSKLARVLPFDLDLDGNPSRRLWVVEHPVKRPTRRSTHADVQLLQEVSDLISTEVVARPALREKVKPEWWKGQVPKGAHHRRIEGLLTAEECALIRPYISTTPVHANAKEILDAVGIGLWRCGRLAGTKEPRRLT